MDVLVALNIALGLVAVYLIFALAVTSFNEGIAAMLSSRANWLRKGIEKLLDGGTNVARSDADKFYDSPFIAYLGEGGLLQGNKPSYIPAWTIAQGLLASVSKAGTQTFESIDKIKEAIAGLPKDSPIAVAFNDLVTQAGTDAAKFRSLVEEWFKTFDAQVIAWYRQKTQYVVLALSAFVVVAMNVDTIAIVRQLSSDTQARDAMVKVALDLAKQGAPDKVLDTAARDKAKKAFDDAAKEVDDAKKQVLEKAWLDEQRKLEQAAVDRIKGLSATGLKLGWTDGDPALTNGYAWVVKILGLLMSALAVSLGAPFWFDTLKKIAAIRSVGLNVGEREADEKTKTTKK